MLLALTAKTKTVRPVTAIRGVSSFSTKEGWTVLGAADISGVYGESTVAAFQGTKAAIGLCMLSEDEAESHVQAAHGKEEEGGDKREFVNVVGEDRCPNAKLANSHSSSVPTSVATRKGKKLLTVPGKSRGVRGQIENRGPGKSAQRRPSATRSRKGGERQAGR